jgi:predicted Zn-dependent protease
MAREIRKEHLILRDRVIVGYLSDIAERILRASGPQPFQYRFYVVEDEKVNASAGFAGHVLVHTGLILRAENVSELAGVLAHEIGHVVNRDVAANYNRVRNTGLLYQFGVLAASVFGYGGLASLGGALAGTALLNSFGREAERDADAFAVRVLPAAGYDPNGLVSFFEKIRQEGARDAPTFLSSHPTTEERIAETRAAIAQLPPSPGLEVADRGKLEIIQQRIRLLTGAPAPGSDEDLNPL